MCAKHENPVGLVYTAVRWRPTDSATAGHLTAGADCRPTFRTWNTALRNVTWERPCCFSTEV